jgi:hypothetical protein
MSRYPLTEAQFLAFGAQADWRINEASFSEIYRLPNIPRKSDIVGTFISGDMNATKMLNGIDSVIGLDVLVYERNPHIDKEEPPLNIYHCVIQKLSAPVGPYGYLMYGPYKDGTLCGHWRDEAVIDEYRDALNR